jgi:diguanylate cyclase (GGDEF)-like protein
MRFPGFILVLICACLLGEAQALQPDKAFHHYVRDRWSIQNGLPQISALSIAQDRQGYIWVGTQSGLARFDGVRFVNFSPDTDPQIPATWVRALHAARDGRLWIGTYKGVAVYDGLNFKQVPASDLARWPELDVFAFAEDQVGEIWVATGSGVFKVQGNQLLPVEGSPVPAQALLLRDDSLWVGSRGAVHRLTGVRWDSLALPEAASTVLVNNIVETQGRVWAATGKGLFYRSDDGWQRFQQAPALADAAIDLLKADSDGNLWAGGDNGLARIRDGKLAEFVDANGPGAIGGLRVAFEDREGNLWMGSQWEGLTRLLDSWTRRFSVPEGLKDPIVWSVSPDPDGKRIWVGVNNGVSLLENGRFTSVASGNSLPDPHGYNVLAEKDRLWIGTRRGLAVIDHRGPQAGKVQQPALLEPLAALQINGIVRTPDNDVWIPSSDGLFRLRGDRLKRYGQEDGLTDPRIRFFHRGASGRVLLGAQTGLFEMRGERFVQLGLESGLPQGIDVLTVVELKDGRVVIGTVSERLYFSDGTRWHELGKDQGFSPNAPVYLTEHGGYLWIGGTRGISRVPVKDFAAFASGRIKKVGIEMLISDRGDPMSGQQGFCCNGAGNSKGFRQGQTLWLPSRDGVVALDIDSIVKNTLPPNVVIERVQVNDAWRPADAKGNWKLPANVRDLSFEFTVLSFQDPKSNVVQYRLRGYDHDWRESDNLRRDTRYTSLPAGDYVFEVRGYNNASLPSAKIAQLPISLQPHFHETKLFLVLVGLLMCLAAFGGYRYLLYRHQQQRKSLEALVQQRTRALEVANRQLEEASHTDLLTGLRNRRYMASQMPADMAYFDRQIQQGVHLGEEMVFALVDIDHFKSVNDTHGHKAGDLILQQFAQVLGGLVRTGDYVVRWGGEEFLLVFRPMPTRDLTAIGDRLRTLLCTNAFDTGTGARVRLTASAGMSEYPFFPGHPIQPSWETMIELADQALYYVKSHGRNGWAAFRPTETSNVATLAQELAQDAERLLQTGRVQLVSSLNPVSEES